MRADRSQEFRLTLVYALLTVVWAVGYRLVPYYLLGGHRPLLWNFAPVGALALFAGSRLRRPHAYLFPLAVLLLSDLLFIPAFKALGIEGSPFRWSTPVVYASFALYVLLGRLLRPDEASPLVIGGCALLGGLQFFVLTNFAVWLLDPTDYAPTFSGLVECYLMGLPLYRNTVAGDLLFCGVIFGLHAVLLHLFSPAAGPALLTSRDRQGPGGARSPAC